MNAADWRIWPVVLALVCTPLGTAVAAPQTTPSQAAVADARRLLRALSEASNVTDQDRKRLEGLISSLGAPTFKERESATQALSLADPSIIPLLEKACLQEDPEIRLRVPSIIKAIERHTATNSDTLAMASAIDTLVMAKDKELPNLLIGALSSAERDVRHTAEYGLLRVTGLDFGYCASAPPASRADAVARWQKWWATAGSTFDFAQAAQHLTTGILIADDQGRKIHLLNLDSGNLIWTRDVGGVCYAADMTTSDRCVIAMGSSVVEYDGDGKEKWKPARLDPATRTIYDARLLPNNNKLICCVDDGCVVEASPDGRVVWQIQGLSSPGAAERLADGNTLISVNHGGKVVEVNNGGAVVWQKDGLNNPSDATRLLNGNILIAEWGARRIVEVDRRGEIVWQYRCNGNPASAFRLANGTTLIQEEGKTFVVGNDGKVVRELFKCTQRYGKARPVRLPGRGNQSI